MRNIIMKILFASIFVLISTLLMSQSTLQLKLSVLGMHPFTETNSHLFENRIDANGIFITEPGLIFSFENFLRSDTFAWRGIFGFFSDAASKPAIFLHLGVKQRILQIWRNSFSICAGGNLYGRDVWGTIPGYITDHSWSANGDWEYKLGFMVELEYALFLNDKNDITLSVIYGHQPNTFTFSVGYKYWLSSIIKNPKKCGSCPFQKTSKHWTP
ncbi:MAG: hypothetical protein PHZ24_08675 [Bacteroidales bacterium]|nr:hypothetical protein [Bacteroidales bacterium]